MLSGQGPHVMTVQSAHSQMTLSAVKRMHALWRKRVIGVLG